MRPPHLEFVPGLRVTGPIGEGLAEGWDYDGGSCRWTVFLLDSHCLVQMAALTPYVLLSPLAGT
jgi:hypothetical protein